MFWLRAAGKADAAGFLGPGSLLADVNLTLEILLVVGLTVGMMLARRGTIEAHRVNQSDRGCWSTRGWSRVMMAPSLANVKVSQLRRSRTSVRRVTVAARDGRRTDGHRRAVAGAADERRAAEGAGTSRGWKPLMRTTLAGYWAVALLGIVLYFVWYAG